MVIRRSEEALHVALDMVRCRARSDWKRTVTIERRTAPAACAPDRATDNRSIIDDVPVLPLETRPDRHVEDSGLPRVTHFSHNDQRGGGPLASFRLHRALIDRGVDSRMLVMRKHHDDPSIETIASPLPSRLIEVPARIADRLPLRLYPGRRRDVIWSPGWFSMPNIAACRSAIDADILSLYWVNGGFLSIKAVDALLRLGKPVVWRLSDLWAFTGGCHHAGDCRGYRQACGQCPQLRSRSSNDLSARMLRARMRWPHQQLVVVAPSRWLGDLAKSSTVFGNCRIEHITTGIDVETFSPRPRDEARQRLGLPKDRTLILFGANNGVRNPKKGFSLLVEALQRLVASGRAGDVDLVLFGQKTEPRLPLDLPVHMMGSIADERAKAALFSAADLFATPSLEENLPNTVIEAMACGTPSVAFDVGGTGELIEHGINGYLAKAGDSSDFCRGLGFVLDQRADEPGLGVAARDFVLCHHDLCKVARRYLDLYLELHGATCRDRAA